MPVNSKNSHVNRHLCLDMLLMQHLGLTLIVGLRCWKGNNGLVKQKIKTGGHNNEDLQHEY